ncbi:M23 family metallopeptidase [Streptomyces capparidis]
MALNQPAPSSAVPAWNPTEDDLAPVRGRHRLPKSRTVGRGSTVLGVATMAAMGVGGVATAQGKSPVPISMPDSLPGITEAPGAGTSSAADEAAAPSAGTKVAQVANAGELLRTRILAQAEQQQASALDADRATAEKEAAEAAAKEAAARKVREAAAKKAEEKKAAAEKAEAERKAKEAAAREAARNSFVVPTSNYTITASYGQAGDRWSANHTGTDFAAPSGTAVRAAGAGEITSAGWAGAYGYRVIVTHEDGTQTWYCHLSSMVQTSGTVAAGDTIGRVGATGNVTGPHLHFEVHVGGSPVDPAAWLNSKGVTV